jgi:polyhydroxyalkanoate synthesis repressor PhaR
MAKVRVIKKYPNRRLYDTEISSYVTVEDVRQLVMDGDPFEVRDARTGDDITRTVLLQIIAEHEEHDQPLFSTPLLAKFIRCYGDALQGYMGTYLERSLETFFEQSQQFRSQLNDLIGKTPWAVVNDVSERNLDLWKSMQEKLLSGAPLATKPQAPPVAKAAGKK